MPFADLNCFPIPDDVPDEKALYMSDVLCTSLHSVVMGEVQEGSTVAIWGLGPIGLMAVRWCVPALSQIAQVFASLLREVVLWCNAAAL